MFVVGFVIGLVVGGAVVYIFRDKIKAKVDQVD